MCDRSQWRFICEGRYDILLLMLVGTVLVGALALMLFSYAVQQYHARHPQDGFFLVARNAFLHGDIDASRFIGRCGNAPGGEGKNR